MEDSGIDSGDKTYLRNFESDHIMVVIEKKRPVSIVFLPTLNTVLFFFFSSCLMLCSTKNNWIHGNFLDKL